MQKKRAGGRGGNLRKVRLTSAVVPVVALAGSVVSQERIVALQRCWKRKQHRVSVLEGGKGGPWAANTHLVCGATLCSRCATRRVKENRKEQKRVHERSTEVRIV